MPGPADVEVAARHVRIGGDYAATLAVTGYPAEVSAGWLEPLAAYPGRLDVTLHIEPIPVPWPPRGCGGSAPGWNRGAAPTPTAATSMTPTPRPPPMTPATWPTGSPAVRASCSASACT